MEMLKLISELSKFIIKNGGPVSKFWFIASLGRGGWVRNK
jgi:hypothetical protein